MAVRFFVVSALLLSMGGALAYVMIRWWWAGVSVSEAGLPTVFWVSTAMLFGGSAALNRSLTAVRRERQGLFRRYLLAALLSGATFLGVQSSGLWCLLDNQSAVQVATGVNAFVTVLVALHALHFTLALLFVVFVTVNGFADRYDHEYYFGVSVCTAFWHILCVVWLAILGVFAIAT
jgi:heme/copper-type cytochrome/quinol oxidase subunit 3